MTVYHELDDINKRMGRIMLMVKQIKMICDDVGIKELKEYDD